MSLDDLRIIRGKIKERVHHWSAGSTSVSDLSMEEARLVWDYIQQMER